MNQKEADVTDSETEGREAQVREEIVTRCRQLAAEGLVTGTAGNISIRMSTGMLITPSGVPYQAMQPDQICYVPFEDPAAARSSGTASSESPMHKAIYESTGAKAIVHYHGLYSTAVATTYDLLPVIHYYAMRLGGSIAVAPYETFGSELLAAAVRDALSERKAALLRNHGGIAIGDTLEQAFNNASLLEWLCKLFSVSVSMGTPHELTAHEMQAVADKYSPASIQAHPVAQPARARPGVL